MEAGGWGEATMAEIEMEDTVMPKTEKEFSIYWRLGSNMKQSVRRSSRTPTTRYRSSRLLMEDDSEVVGETVEDAPEQHYYLLLYTK